MRKKEKPVVLVNTGWKWKLILTGICVALAVILQIAARMTNGFGEFYAEYIYPLWVNTIGRLMGVFPVSMIEILIYIAIVIFVFKMIKLIFFASGYRKLYAGCMGMSAVALAAMIFLSYTLNCGINYYRTPFSQVEGFEIKEYSVEQLYELCQSLTQEVNDCSKGIIRNAKGLCKLDTGVENRAREAMSNLSETYTSLKGYYPPAKPLIVSSILSYQNLTGIYSPFTVEANYNRSMTAYNIPFTICHELSHLKGFMREDEANFIAYLGCIGSEDIDFKYSGLLMGWVYATNALAKEDMAMYTEISGQLSPEIRSDLDANTVFWNKYEGKIAEISNKVNDTYLKANNQSDGVKSYSRMVDLMLANYFQKQ